MNWYARYAGDYMQDTAHLSLVEHGAYTMMLDLYYGPEKPLPNDDVALFRICRAFTAEEQEAVLSVARQYFPVCDDGLRHNGRADREIAKRRVISQKRSMAGVKGADGKWHNKSDGKADDKNMANATTSTSTSTSTPTATKDTPQPPKGGVARFKPPSANDVNAYCLERKNAVDAECFIDHYTANGWKVGKNPMKDWKAAVRTWERNNLNNGGSRGQSQPVHPSEDYEKIYAPENLNWHRCDGNAEKSKPMSDEERDAIIAKGQIPF